MDDDGATLATLLKTLRERAEAVEGVPVTSVLLALPADADAAAEARLAKAWAAAALPGAVATIPAVDATVLGMGYDVAFEEGQRIIGVVDVGAGSVDAAVVRIDDGHFETLGSASVRGAGGVACDDAIMRWAQSDFLRKNKAGPETLAGAVGAPSAQMRLRAAVKEARIALSKGKRTQIIVDALAGGLDCSTPLARDRMEAICGPVLKRAIPDAVKKAMSQAGMESEDIAEIVLAGGCGRMPLVKTIVEAAFDDEVEIEMEEETNDQLMVMGAALQAALAANGAAAPADPTAEVQGLAKALFIRTKDGELEELAPQGASLPFATEIEVGEASEGYVEVVEGDDTVVGRWELKSGAGDVEITISSSLELACHFKDE